MNEHTQQRMGRRGRPTIDEDDRPGRGRGRHGRRGRSGPGRIRRGEVRAALLIALLDGPGHGYELIQALEAKTDGRWRPSPGSVYPTLQLLADEDLVTSTEQDGKRVFQLTDQGRTTAEEHVAAKGYPWDRMDDDGGGSDLRAAAKGLMAAFRTVETTGSTEDVAKAVEILTTARKDLYRLLAED